MTAHARESPNLKQASLLLAREQEQAASRQAWLTGIKSVDAHLKDVLSSGKVIALASRSDRDETIVRHLPDVHSRDVGHC